MQTQLHKFVAACCGLMILGCGEPTSPALPQVNISASANPSPAKPSPAKRSQPGKLSVPQIAPHQTKIKTVPIDWVKDPPQIKRVDFGAAKFKSPELQATIKRWEVATEELCAAKSKASQTMRQTLPGISWHQEPWYYQPRDQGHPGYSVIRWWTNTPTMMVPEGYFHYRDIRTFPYHEPRFFRFRGLSAAHYRALSVAQELSYVTISFWMNMQNFDAGGARLRVLWIPKTDWGAELIYETSGSVPEKVIFTFMKQSTAATFSPAVLGYWHHRAVFNESLSYGSGVPNPEFNQLEFTLEVSLPLGLANRNAQGAAILYQQLLVMQKSPDDFKRVCLQTLDELAEKIENDFASGAVTKQAHFPVNPAYHSSGEPPEVLSMPANRKLTAAERQSLLEMARQSVARRREFIEQEYVELHTALQQVFPLKSLEGK